MYTQQSICLLLILLVLPSSVPMKSVSYFDTKKCDIGPLADEIASYQSVVQSILDYVISGPFKGKTYDELAFFVDKFGARPSGSDVLEKSIEYMIQLSKKADLNVDSEKVEVPHWIRGSEHLMMIRPRRLLMALLGLGESVSTPKKGIVADVIVVSNFSMLEDIPDEKVKGKIVLFNTVFTHYGETAAIRKNCASKAAKKGAVASLLRSVTPFSMYSPHTGSQTYEKGVPQIPSAAITLEDADLIERLYTKGERVVLKLKMISTLEKAESSNTIVDLKGNQMPEKLVIVSGHIDSWDVGQGAMDDGGGLFLSWAVPVILTQMNLKPKRTIRSIFWTAEELGLIGAIDYEKKHREEARKINFIMESDEGSFAPLGLAVAGTQQARCIVAAILNLFESIDADQLEEDDSPGSDITVLIKSGIPGASLLNANEKYFWYHHTQADTMNVENPDELDLGAAFWTAFAYVLADISADIPR